MQTAGQPSLDPVETPNNYGPLGTQTLDRNYMPLQRYFTNKEYYKGDRPHYKTIKPLAEILEEVGADGLSRTLDTYVEQKLLTVEKAWVITIMFPIKRVDAAYETGTIQWTVVEHNNTPADEIPEGVAPRLVTFQEQKKTTRLIRRGLAADIHDEDLSNPEGTRLFMEKLDTIASSIAISFIYQAFQTIMTTKTAEQAYKELFSLMTNADIVIAAAQMYLATVKDVTGASRYIAMAEASLKQEGYTPGAIAVTQGGEFYFRNSGIAPMTLNIMDNTDGNSQIVTINPAAVYNGNTPVFTVDTYFKELGIAAPNVLPTRVGEFNTMFFDPSCDFSKYDSKRRSIKIYNASTDNPECIGLDYALRYCGIFDVDGKYDRRFHKYIEEMNEKKRHNKKSQGMYNDDDDEDYQDNNHSYSQQKMPFIVKSKEGICKPLGVLGAMRLDCCDHKDFRAVVHGLYNCFRDDIKASIDSFIDIACKSERTIPTEYMVKAYIKANLPYNVDSEGNFVGHISNSGIENGVTEWHKNQYGFVEIPDFDKNDPLKPDCPFGIHNGPGMQTFMEFANKPNSCWYEMARDALPGYEATCHIVDFLAYVYPKSGTLDPKNLPSWFQDVPNRYGVAFADLFFKPCDVTFMEYTGVDLDENGNVKGLALAPEGPGSDRGKIPWKPIPLFEWDEEYLERPDRGVRYADRDVTIEGNLSYITNDGVKIDIPIEYLVHGGYIPSKVRAKSILGSNVATYYNQLVTALPPDDRNKMEDILTSILLNFYQTALTLETEQKQNKCINSAKKFIVALEILRRTNQKKFDKYKDQLLKLDSASVTEEIKTLISKLGKEPEALGAEEIIKGEKKPDLSIFSFKNLKKIDNYPQETSQLSTAIDFILSHPQLLKISGLSLDDIGGIKTFIGGGGRYAAVSAAVSKEKFSAFVKSLNVIATTKVEGNDLLFIRDLVEDYRSRRGEPTMRDGRARAESVSYRCTIASSRELLIWVGTQSLPLIRPSDPRKSHLQPYSPGSDGWKSKVTRAPSAPTGPTGEGLSSQMQFSGFFKATSADDAKYKPKTFVDPAIYEGRIEYTDFYRIKQIGKKPEDFLMVRRLIYSSCKDYEKEKYGHYGYHTEDYSYESYKKRKSSVGKKKKRNLYDDLGKDWTTRSMKTRKYSRMMERMAVGSDDWDNEDEDENDFLMDLDCVLTKDFIERLNKCNISHLDSLHRVFYYATLFAKACRLNTWVNMVEKNIPIPLGFLLFRNNIVNETSTWVVAEPGRDLGETYMSPSRFVFGHNPELRRWFASQTMAAAVSIRRHKKMMLLYNIQPHKYLGGSNLKPILHPDDFKASGTEKPSIFVAVVPCNFRNTDVMIDISGKYYMSGELIRGTTDNPYDYPTSDYYRRIYEFDSLFAGHLHTNYGICDQDQYNPICLKAGQYVYADYGGYEYQRGQSAREGGLVAGSRATYDGHKFYFPKADIAPLA